MAAALILIDHLVLYWTSRWWQSRTRKQRVCWSLTWKGRATASGWRNRRSATISLCENPPTDAITAISCVHMFKLHALWFAYLVLFKFVVWRCIKRHLQMHICYWTGQTYWIWSLFTQVQRYKIQKTVQGR